ncbi:MAG: hypothetical protein COT90_03930 [Candidatus Diapherotrites archaeon CG10_big_fil_rev_8_21_14_0_10_31_34]|nr:MAG: hypothetical protein COT90_03930 [Candidatus Diapherotrites archaeon CG10_big_fil_rev_8_21_14_0_10_31_34]PJA20330.1 MAG: hypothetical protein COX63_00900 [Candidatus Diapherotrites archaeon CG_4_10_14_0_2_um_filter_31_5]
MDKISELRPFQKKVELAVKVLEKNEVREVTSKLDNSNHKVTEALVGDESGIILLTLWDDMIDRVELEKTYKIANAYTSLFKNCLRLNIGRYGELTDSKEEVAEVNKENNVSEKEFEQRGRFGGGNRGRFGGGGNRRSFDRSPKSESKPASDDSDSDSSDSDSESNSDSDDSDDSSDE